MMEVRSAAMKNFHLSLPEETYIRLRAEAERTQVPAATLAREALDEWLRQQSRKARHDAIAVYATEMAGTQLDLDTDLESARVEHLMKTGKPDEAGEVYWADLVPGLEQTGRRPVILISHDGFNQVPGWRLIIVVPVSTSSSQGQHGPTVIELSGGAAGLPKKSFAACHQVTTLDRAKMTRRIGTLPLELTREVEEGLKAAMDLD